ncbi:MAG: STAS domain-containing protein [Acidimicrobiia bacterium]
MTSPVADEPANAEFEVDDEGGVPVVSLRGEVDVASSPDLRDCLYRTIARGTERVVVDLAGLTFIDSSGLGVLVGALKRIRERGGELELRGLHDPSRRVFEITGLTKLFTVT